MRLWSGLALLPILLLPSIAFAQSSEIDGTKVAFQTELTGLERPVALMSPPGDARIFVVEKTGRILVVWPGTQRADVFLNLTAKVSGGNEQGLLGLAFHPDYHENGRFFVDYTDVQGNTQIVGYRVAEDGTFADPDSAVQVLSIRQPYANHNGGWLGFGPDGLLYIGMGDGGAGGDPNGYAQNKRSLLGKILRIDVDGAAPYAIPPGNPFATADGAPEIFLLGLRNPWRNAFDGDQLYIGDVGQDAWEEIDVVSTKDAGANLGWNTVEGSNCYPPGALCEQGGFVAPVHTYSHGEGCSITGGFVYRGGDLPKLQGRYFFADYCRGTLEGLRMKDGVATDLVDTADGLGSLGNINAFGADSAGELYVLTDDGRVLKMVAAE
ncbi:MAG: PQQ-dependent sugar dehydrogenase [Devosia sp.]